VKDAQLKRSATGLQQNPATDSLTFSIPRSKMASATITGESRLKAFGTNLKI